MKRYHIKKTGMRLLFSMTLLIVSVEMTFSADKPFLWISPIFPTTELVEKQITVVDRYQYVVMEYTPPVRIQAVSKDDQRADSPETAMISRVSAMMNQNYDWWLKMWDPISRKLTINRERALGFTEDARLQLWKSLFSVARVTLIRRIETGEYVVLTYKLLTEEGKDVGNDIEYPVVFKQFEKKWFATQDLSRDALVPASPWVSGKDRLETTIE